MENKASEKGAQPKPEQIVVSSVNSMIVHPISQMLTTGGDDGTAATWNVHTMKKIAEYIYPQSIQSLAFGEDGQKLAVGCSTFPYKYDGTNKFIQAPVIVIREVPIIGVLQA